MKIYSIQISNGNSKQIYLRLRTGYTLYLMTDRTNFKEPLTIDKQVFEMILVTKVKKVGQYRKSHQKHRMWILTEAELGNFQSTSMLRLILASEFPNPYYRWRLFTIGSTHIDCGLPNFAYDHGVLRHWSNAIFSSPFTAGRHSLSFMVDQYSESWMATGRTKLRSIFRFKLFIDKSITVIERHFIQAALIHEAI